MARRPGAAPDKHGFGDLAALLAHVACFGKLVGSAGLAPALPESKSGIPLLGMTALLK